MSECAGKQFVGIDLHRRRSVVVRTDEVGEVLETVRILNEPRPTGSEGTLRKHAVGIVAGPADEAAGPKGRAIGRDRLGYGDGADRRCLEAAPRDEGAKATVSPPTPRCASSSTIRPPIDWPAVATRSSPW
jgi:hypothetical protein